MILLTAVLALAGAACSNLGLGEAACNPPERGLSSANILTVQAVPTAKYTPCLNEIRLGWDRVDWFGASGRAGIKVMENERPVMTATVVGSCDVSGATPVPSGYPDIERFESVTSQVGPIGITIVPTSEIALEAARGLSIDLRNVDLDDRRVRFTVADDFEVPAATRLDSALASGEFVWIIDELDAHEGTVELRSTIAGVAGSGLPAEALDEIEDHLPEQFYRGHWYFVFEGGCITYEFDAKGAIAETLAEDVNDAVGFYPAYQLRQLAEEAGYDLTGD